MYRRSCHRWPHGPRRQGQVRRMAIGTAAPQGRAERTAGEAGRRLLQLVGWGQVWP